MFYLFMFMKKFNLKKTEKHKKLNLKKLENFF